MKIIFLSLLNILLVTVSYSQEPDANIKSGYIRVYLDGVNDWQNYIKVKLWYVDYVRDPEQAQVHVLITTQPTASGGSEYYVMFLGRNNFKGRNDTLQLTASSDNSNRHTRDELTNVITMGLMPYLSANGQQKYMSFDYTNKNKLIEQSIDKWKNWVFTITVNTDFNADQTSEVFFGDGSLSAANITDKWKHRITIGGSYGNNNYETSTYTFTGNRIIQDMQALSVKSINDHWSLGLQLAYYSSTYSNVKSQFSFAPGVEYDFFPYSESVNNLLTIKYRLQPLYNIYIDSTVFFKTNEFLMNNIVDVTYTVFASWGNISSTLTASDYLNHYKAYRFDLTTQMNIRIAKGLFFNVTGNASLINNQLSISKVNLQPEQIILQQRESLTNYKYGFHIGIRYTFGSIYNNIVNPRYEGGVNIDQEVNKVEKVD